MTPVQSSRQCFLTSSCLSERRGFRSALQPAIRSFAGAPQGGYMAIRTLAVPEQHVFRIFISYASEDVAIATAAAICFKTALPDFFAEVNFDKEFLEPGSAFQGQIEAKLQQTDVLSSSTPVPKNAAMDIQDGRSGSSITSCGPIPAVARKSLSTCLAPRQLQPRNRASRSGCQRSN